MFHLYFVGQRSGFGIAILPRWFLPGIDSEDRIEISG